MRKIIISVLSLFYVLCLFAQDNTSALLPMPNYISSTMGDALVIDEQAMSIGFNSTDLKFAAQKLQDVIYKRMGKKISISSSVKSKIRLEIDNTLDNDEQYLIDVSSEGLIIRGASKGAVYYGVITLDQILLGDICMTSRNQIQGIHVNDKPRFTYRAMMLDPARSFLPVEDVKFFIDKMSLFKYNVLQLHLTDDQGWRIYIDKYPQLVSKEHYTKMDLKQIIEYAEERNVMVIPEIDIPGHSSALLSAFPELKCQHKDTVPVEVGNTFNMMVCAAVDEGYSILGDIIKETAEIFPAKYIHLGGDEAAIESNWAVCPRCKQLMDKLGYDKPSQLMIPFFNKVLNSVEKAGKIAILWCELDSIYMPANNYLFPYPQETVLVSWRGGLTSKCLELTYKYGNSLIMAPGEYAYLDYPQYQGDFPEFNNWGMPITTLETCYKFDPGYGLPKQKQKHVMGVMATLWGEAIKDINRATYMAFPRGLALAESGWTDMEQRHWESFKQRILPNLINLVKQGVSVRVPFEVYLENN